MRLKYIILKSDSVNLKMVLAVSMTYWIKELLYEEVAKYDVL